MKNPDILNIGVICLDAGNAATITDHITAITKGSRHHSEILSVWPHNCLLHVDLGLFDVLIIHYTIVAKDHTFLVPAVREQIKKFTGLKVAFIQDEYRFIDATTDALRELGIGLLFTCVPAPEITKVYSPEKLPGMKTLNVLTGYVPENLVQLKVPLYEHRAVDIGYRSRKVPMWLGELGWEKYIIAVKFPESAARYRFRLDISCREEDRIYGQDWIRFTYSCKAFLGVESGASVFDFTGDIQRHVEAHEAREPDVTFEELQRLYFSEHEGKIRLNQISPRCFEAVALRTLLILYEGDYSGILIPWRHFVPLKKDHSNIDEVAAIVLNRQRAKSIIDAAYTEVACNPEYSFAAFSKNVDRAIEAAILPAQRRHTDPGYIKQAIAWADEQGKSNFGELASNPKHNAPAFNKYVDRARPAAKFLFRTINGSSGHSKLFTIMRDFALLPAKRWSQLGKWRSLYYQALIGLSSRLSPLLITRRLEPRLPTVVFLHSSYYHFPLLARELRRRGWNAWAVTLDDPSDVDAIYSYEADLSIRRSNPEHQALVIDRFLDEVKRKCDIVHFSGVGMMRISPEQGELGVTEPNFPTEFMDLKKAGVRIGYSSVGCNDGISQSKWYEWTGGMCDKCRFQTEPDVCSDIRNLAWGHKLTMVCDVIASELLPRLDYLAGDSTVRAPFAFCVDEQEWRPGLDIPDALRVESNASEIIVLHAMGNYAKRTSGNADPKGTRHVTEAIDSLRAEGLPIRLHFVDNLPTQEMKYVQAQAHIVVDQLYFGRYGAMARECLMLGKPVVGFIKVNREEESDDALACLDECPIVNASPKTLKEVLRDLALSPNKRTELGLRSREFALKWHSVAAAADQFENVWRDRFGIST